MVPNSASCCLLPAPPAPSPLPHMHSSPHHLPAELTLFSADLVFSAFGPLHRLLPQQECILPPPGRGKQPTAGRVSCSFLGVSQPLGYPSLYATQYLPHWTVTGFLFPNPTPDRKLLEGKDHSASLGLSALAQGLAQEETLNNPGPGFPGRRDYFMVLPTPSALPLIGNMWEEGQGWGNLTHLPSRKLSSRVG